MIEIKSRYDGRVLYTAEHAQDVRAALREAVAAGADLSGADLSGAYLRSAYLRSAYLSGAYLRSAYLSGAYLRSAYLSGADLRSADLSGAYLRSADLRSADLRSADLSGAYLRSADLRSADLSGAYLRSAYLRSADLSGAVGLNPLVTTPLHMLADQPGPIRAYKLVTADGGGLIRGGIVFEHGQSYEVTDANCDPAVSCAAGINVATLDWCLKEWRDGYRILLVEFTAADIAAIPHGSDGKFRLHRCRVVGEKSLADVGLPPQDRRAA